MLDTILPKAPPMITPTARSMTFPLKAKFLNSSNRLIAALVGSAMVDSLTVEIDGEKSDVSH